MHSISLPRLPPLRAVRRFSSLTMQNLPTAEVYEKEFKYFPWGRLIQEVQEYVIVSTPPNGDVLDILCGPGYLLGQLNRQRSDLHCTGVDLEAEYIEYAQKTYPELHFVTADARTWQSAVQYDVILCTAGLHHLEYEQQEGFVKKLASLLKEDGFAIIADPYISDYNNERERKLAAAELGCEYLKATIQNDGPKDLLEAAINILSNDVLGVEFKSSIKKNCALFEKYFSKSEMYKTWPDKDTEYGDYYFILRK